MSAKETLQLTAVVAWRWRLRGDRSRCITRHGGSSRTRTPSGALSREYVTVTEPCPHVQPSVRVHGKTASATACEDACAREANCSVWTWHDANAAGYEYLCYLRLDNQCDNIMSSSMQLCLSMVILHRQPGGILLVSRTTSAVASRAMLTVAMAKTSTSPVSQVQLSHRLRRTQLPGQNIEDITGLQVGGAGEKRGIRAK